MNRYAIILIVPLIVACSKEEKFPTSSESELYYSHGEVETLFQNKPNGINILFIGDGYIQKDLQRVRSTYRNDAIKHIDYLFNSPPFSDYKEYFNAYIVYAESNDEGPVYDTRLKSTAFGVVQGDVNPNFYNEGKLETFIKNITIHIDQNISNTLVLLSCKNGKGGIGPKGVAIFSNTNQATMLHEVGHSFAFLGDEYEKHPTKEMGFMANTEFASNLDSIGDPVKIKWKHFLGLPKYERVGAYEGGGYTEKGIWRPEENSIMRESFGGKYPYFNAPSREAIVKRILELNGQSYSFDQFILLDKIALDSINSHLYRSKKTTQEIDCGYYDIKDD